VKSPKLANRGHWTDVPAELYATVPLDHAVVLTKRGADNAAARRYLDFLSSEPAKKIFREYGYRVP
jgi:ABC-type molybdate transport system substrate-binding protein